MTRGATRSATETHQVVEGEPGPTAADGRGAGLAAVVGATVAFSWGFVLVKHLPLQAGVLASWRLAIGGGVLLVAALLLRVSWPRSVRLIVAAGLAFGVHQLLFILAIQATSIAIVTLLGALQPLLVSLVSRRTVGEPVSRALVCCSLLAVAGVVVVVQANAGDASSSLFGNLLSIANLFAFTAYFLLARRARDAGAPTLTLTAAFMLIALVVVLPFALLRGESFQVTSVELGLLALLALLPGNGHLLVNWAHTRVSAALSSLALAAVPLLAGVWAALVLGEPYGWQHLAGMLLVVAAIEWGRRVERRDWLQAGTELVAVDPAGGGLGGR